MPVCIWAHTRAHSREIMSDINAFCRCRLMAGTTMISYKRYSLSRFRKHFPFFFFSIHYTWQKSKIFYKTFYKNYLNGNLSDNCYANIQHNTTHVAVVLSTRTRIIPSGRSTSQRRTSYLREQINNRQQKTANWNHRSLLKAPDMLRKLSIRFIKNSYVLKNF